MLPVNKLHFSHQTSSKVLSPQQHPNKQASPWDGGVIRADVVSAVQLQRPLQGVSTVLTALLTNHKTLTWESMVYVLFVVCVCVYQSDTMLKMVGSNET